MKVLVVVAFFAFAAIAQALSDQQKQALGKYYSECVASSGVDESLIKKMRAGDIAEDEHLKKYVGCMFGKLNFIADGKLNEEVIVSKIPADFDHEEAKKILTECKEVKATDNDGISFEAYKCFLGKTTKFIEF